MVSHCRRQHTCSVRMFPLLSLCPASTPFLRPIHSLCTLETNTKLQRDRRYSTAGILVNCLLHARGTSHLSITLLQGERAIRNKNGRVTLPTTACQIVEAARPLITRTNNASAQLGPDSRPPSPPKTKLHHSNENDTQARTKPNANDSHMNNTLHAPRLTCASHRVLQTRSIIQP